MLAYKWREQNVEQIAKNKTILTRNGGYTNDISFGNDCRRSRG